jgi:hypothetical protein
VLLSIAGGGPGLFEINRRRRWSRRPPTSQHHLRHVIDDSPATRCVTSSLPGSRRAGRRTSFKASPRGRVVAAGSAAHVAGERLRRGQGSTATAGGSRAAGRHRQRRLRRRQRRPRQSAPAGSATAPGPQHHVRVPPAVFRHRRCRTARREAPNGEAHHSGALQAGAA